MRSRQYESAIIVLARCGRALRKRGGARVDSIGISIAISRHALNIHIHGSLHLPYSASLWVLIPCGVRQADPRFFGCWLSVLYWLFLVLRSAPSNPPANRAWRGPSMHYCRP